MVIKIICVIITVVLIALLLRLLDSIIRKDRTKISFKEAMDLTELPVVTFYNGDKKLNFLLDTGCNTCIIDSNILSDVKYTSVQETINTMGMEGNMVNSQLCNISIYYNKFKFDSIFSILDMSKSFGYIKETNGVQIHGILGTNFFEKYGYILDFNAMIFYSKKI